ncbi:hypothetical protein [Candidatus Tisiphia endosymbiont of Parasteatoda lunata]|uniref:hypothetical protein n=1 Tax=Candidatus Tisiphia endosymbiont of Parasteatoda lunata TaxID=3066275 RepID=UPI00313E3853
MSPINCPENYNHITDSCLDRVYPILYLDCIYVKSRDNHIVVNHSALQVQSLILRHECLMYVLT